MSFRNSVTIVASPRPRVGKTLLARLLTDFQVHEGRSVAAFDLTSSGALAKFLPERATLADISDVRGQMALFDRLVADDNVAKVVDLGDEHYKAFFTLAQRIGFAEEARRRDIAPSVLFMATPESASVEAYTRLHTLVPQLVLTPVHNELFSPSQHRDKYLLPSSGTTQLHLPVLAPALRKYVEAPPFSFDEQHLANARHIPLDSHLELQRWLRKIYLEFRELDLRILLQDLQSSIRLTS
jgi:hypothetical protein